MQLRNLKPSTKMALSTFLISVLIGTGSAIVMLGLLLSDAESGFVLPTMEKVKIKYSYPAVISSMKTTMYEYVADDEDIVVVEKWIESGKKNDQHFIDNVLPIFEADCTSCHSKSSTKTKAAPNIPLKTYEDILITTEAGYSWGSMARQAHLHLFGIGTFLAILSIIMSFSSIREPIKMILISAASIALWVDVLGWWLTKYFVNFAYVIFGAGGIMSSSIIAMAALCLADLWFSVPFLSTAKDEQA